jgi:hypothetical protein
MDQICCQSRPQQDVEQLGRAGLILIGKNRRRKEMFIAIEHTSSVPTGRLHLGYTERLKKQIAVWYHHSVTQMRPLPLTIGARDSTDMLSHHTLTIEGRRAKYWIGGSGTPLVLIHGGWACTATLGAGV